MTEKKNGKRRKERRGTQNNIRMDEGEREKELEEEDKEEEEERKMEGLSHTAYD
jgi:hypothetical protein